MAQKEGKRTIWVARLVSWTRPKLKSIADLRDLILIVAGGLYVLGYLVWACNAYANNLGLLPAVDFQYFIAGIVPALFLLALSLTITGIFLFKRKLADWLDPDVRWKRNLLQFIRGTLLVSVIIFLIVNGDTFKHAFPMQYHKFSSVLSAIILVSLFLLPRSRESANSPPESHPFKVVAAGISDLYSWLGTGYAVLVAVALTVLGLYFFIFNLYPRIPQEFGGGHPRCACLDLKKAEVSDVIQEAILPPSASNPDSLTARSVQLDVHFYDSNVMLVKPHADQDTFRSRTFEIKKDAIQAVAWCK